MLTEATCSASDKGQGENNFGASYHLRQCHFYHYQRVLRGLEGGKKKKSITGNLISYQNHNVKSNAAK